MLLTRQASKEDFEQIASLYKEYNFILDLPRLTALFVVVDDCAPSKVIAVGSLVRLLEASFLTAKDAPRKLRVEAFKMLLEKVEPQARMYGYNSYHTFVYNEQVRHTLKKHFNFQDGTGINMFKWL